MSKYELQVGDRVESLIDQSKFDLYGDPGNEILLHEGDKGTVKWVPSISHTAVEVLWDSGLHVFIYAREVELVRHITGRPVVNG